MSALGLMEVSDNIITYSIEKEQFTTKHVSLAVQRTRWERVTGLVGNVSSLKYVL